MARPWIAIAFVFTVAWARAAETAHLRAPEARLHRRRRADHLFLRRATTAPSTSQAKDRQ